MEYLLCRAWNKLFLHLAAFALCLAFSIGVFAQNQQPDPFSDTDANEIHELIDFYFQTFSEGDFESFATVFSVPYYRTGLPVMNSVDQIVDRYRGFLQDAIERNPNYKATIASRVKVLPLWFDGVLAQVHWQRITTENEFIDEAGEVFVIQKQDGDWKITGWLPLDVREWDQEFDFSHPDALLEAYE